MTRATRRLWAKRFLRAGWLLAPILSTPKMVYNFIIKNVLLCFFMLVVLSICCLSIFAICWSIYDGKIATPEDINYEMKNNPSYIVQCLPEMMLAQQKVTNAPLTRIDLRQSVTYCENANTMLKQKQAIIKAN